MSIPHAFIDELKGRTSISGVIGQFVAWDKRKTRAANGDYWACCPFHQEKTPSFHVTESKNTYYCFGCHESGTAFTFLEKHRKLNFREIVEYLASQAGMTVPEEEPEDREKADKSELLMQMTSLADRYFRQCLHQATGRDALAYIQNRGFCSDTLGLFGIGYAPGNNELLAKLKVEGFTESQLIDGGLARLSDDGSGIYPVFRDRLMFPIRNTRDATIAFGGRAMNDKVPAKYLNSPQTMLFNKSAVLYNHAGARSRAGRGEPLIVVEGYMDALSLHEAGFKRVVAPLGTAITDSHLGQLWRMEKEPLICLDGDTAGRRASERAMHVALPLLKPGYSLRFCMLPERMDPDDFIRDIGIDAFRRLLQRSVPLPDFLWDCSTADQQFDSPDRQALLRAEMKTIIGKIDNNDVRTSYLQYVSGRIWSEFVARDLAGGIRKPGRSDQSRELARIEQTASHLKDSPEYFQTACVLALCMRYPGLVSDHIIEIENLDLTDTDQQEILTAILESCQDIGEGDLAVAVAKRLGDEIVDRILNLQQLKIYPEINPGTSVEDASSLLADLLFRLNANRQARDLISDIDSRHADISCERAVRRLGNLNAEVFNRSSAGRASVEKTRVGNFSASVDDYHMLQQEIDTPGPGLMNSKLGQGGKDKHHLQSSHGSAPCTIIADQNVPEEDRLALDKEIGS